MSGTDPRTKSGIDPRNISGTDPRTKSGTDPRDLLWDWSQKFGVGLTPEACSGIDPRDLVWDWSQKFCLGLISEVLSGIDPRDLVWDWSQRGTLSIESQRPKIGVLGSYPRTAFNDFWDRSHCTPKYSKGLIPEVNKWCSGIDPGTPFINRWDWSRNAIKSVYFNLLKIQMSWSMKHIILTKSIETMTYLHKIMIFY